MRLPKKPRLVLAVVVASALAAIVIGTALGIPSRHMRTEADGSSLPTVQTVSAMKASSAAVSSAPAGVAAAASHLSSPIRQNAGSPPALHLLQGNLGMSKASIYAFSTDGTNICLIVWQRQSICPTTTDSGSMPPGIEFILSPGGPGYLGQSNNVPPAIAGIVSDDIKGVNIEENGSTVSAPITNNSFFADLDEPGDNSFTIALDITYADGSAASVNLTAPGPMKLIQTPSGTELRPN